VALHDEVEARVREILREQWSRRDGRVVPQAEDLTLGNDGVDLDATVLYADLADSTMLVDNYSAIFAAAVYRCFLDASARVIRAESGEITAYDGDRIMAVFVGDSKNTSAVRTALKINYVAREIIRPAIKQQYPNVTYVLNHVVGIDTSKLLVARTGVRGANDLVWVGCAANHAAKMAALPHEFPSYITAEVFNNMNDEAKYGGSDKRLMWEQRNWTAMNRTVYASTWHWKI